MTLEYRISSVQLIYNKGHTMQKSHINISWSHIKNKRYLLQVPKLSRAVLEWLCLPDRWCAAELSCVDPTTPKLICQIYYSGSSARYTAGPTCYLSLIGPARTYYRQDQDASGILSLPKIYGEVEWQRSKSSAITEMSLGKPHALPSLISGRLSASCHYQILFFFPIKNGNSTYKNQIQNNLIRGSIAPT